MTEDDEFETGETEPGAIGVGMGGSCPTCRAPVDLGQEFCLECGSPIRFTPRQKRTQRGRSSEGSAASSSRGSAPVKGGFPWIPFLVVLALIGGGVAFALVDDGGESKSSARDTTEEALPTITNSAPTETESETETTTVEDCSSASPLDDTVPAVGDAGTSTAPTDPSTGLPGEEIPELGTDGAGGFSDPGVPSTDPGSGSSETVTVDRNGNLCPVSDSGTSPDSTGSPADTVPSTDTGDGSSSTPTTTTPGGTSTASGDWPAGEEGFTVIVAGYPNDESRARQVAADLQEDGFTDGGVLNSSEFSSLCPGYWVVFSGRFDTRSQAEGRLDDLSEKDYAGMYVREIKRDGASPTNCTAARPQN